ncbi:MAG: response regulator [Spirochaetia bacterium]|nr:response regulator [Spirochaetia bacterium]
MEKSKSILIVDDSAVARMLLKNTILDQQKNWKIFEASAADEALALLEKEKFNMLSIDYNMPGMNGLELVEIIKKKYPKTKMVILTANVQTSFKEKVESHGIEFLEKPITDEIVKKIINICLK